MDPNVRGLTGLDGHGTGQWYVAEACHLGFATTKQRRTQQDLNIEGNPMTRGAMESRPVTLVVKRGTKALSWVFNHESEATTIARALKNCAWWLIVGGTFVSAEAALKQAQASGALQAFGYWTSALSA